MFARLLKTARAMDRAHFVQANLACIECVYAQAYQRQIHAAVTVLLDLRDSDGVTLAGSCFPDHQEVRNFINDCAKEGSVPTAIVAFSHECAEQAIESRFPKLWRELSDNSSSPCLHVAVIAFGEQIYRTHKRPGKDDCYCY
jgi:hypothetical protein